MLIPITATHLREGKPGDCERCAIALALRDALPDPWYVVGSQASLTYHQRTYPINFGLRGHGISVELVPFVWLRDDLEAFRAQFDDPAIDRDLLTPAEFWVDIPSWYLDHPDRPRA